MSRFTGRQHKGAARVLREERRQEAEARQAAVSHERTRAHRESRCRNCTGTALLAAVFGGAA